MSRPLTAFGSAFNTRRLVASALACVASALPSLATAGEPPNFVFILADDLGYMDVASYAARVRGAPRTSVFYETPNLDRLTDSGVAFSQAYAHQLCSPTRASLLTGKNGAALGFTTATPDTLTYYSAGQEPPRGRSPLDALRHADKISTPRALLNATTLTALPSGQARDNGHDEITLAEMLTGYRSAFVGKWHLGGHGAEGYQPGDQGFETVAYFDAGGSRYTDWRDIWDRKQLVRPQMPQDELQRGDSGEPTGEEYLTDDLTQQAVGFLEGCAASPEQPFFLYLCHFAVHTPIESRPAYENHFRRKLAAWDGEPANAAYAGMVKSLDDSVGAVLRALDGAGLADNTTVIFMSDNGGVDWSRGRSRPPTSNAPFKGGKATLYEGGVRVPLIVRRPGGPSGVWIDTPVFPVDLLPTIADLAGRPVDHDVDGQSFARLLEDAHDYRPRAFYWHYPFNVAVPSPGSGLPLTPHSAVRNGDHKLVFDWHGSVELYNIREDPFERRDLASAEPDLAMSLFRQLSDWIDEHVAPRYLPTRNPGYEPAGDARGPFRDLRHEMLGVAPLTEGGAP